ncbi:MAG: hypothetical protein GY866_26255 [Proteobacteria bacterium]|nr:hypothetical protein [Pseudomonadota bacterium]
MDFELTRENTMIRQAIRDWVSKECPRDIVGELDERGEFPKKLYQKLSKLGFYGMTIAEEYEGEGKNMLGACLVAEEIAYAYPVLAACYSSPTFYGGAVISELGCDDQKERYLPELAKGKIMAALALSETDNTDAEVISTVAESDGEHFLITGTKSYVSLGDQADLIVLLAKTGEESGEGDISTHFCIDAKSEGITVTPVEKMGYKGANFCDVRCDGVRILANDILGGEEQLGKGREQLDAVRNIVLLSVAATAVGISRGAFDYALQHAKQRVQFDQPIGRFPAVNRKFAETAYKIDAARLLLYRAAWSADQGKAYAREAAMAKCFSAETAVGAAMEGLQTLGGYGYTMEYDIQRYIRDAVALLSAGASGDYLKERISAALGLY